MSEVSRGREIPRELAPGIRVMLGLCAAVGLLLPNLGCADGKPEEIEVVASMGMIPDDGRGNRVLLLLPEQGTTEGQAIETAVEWAAGQGWTDDPVDDPRLDLVARTRPAWNQIMLTRRFDRGLLGVMWLGPADDFLAEGGVEASELLRRSEVSDVQHREDLVVAWQVTLRPVP